MNQFERGKNDPSQQDLLNSFQRKVQLIRDRVASVAHGYQTGCYLVGRPGTSKTHTVREELDRLSKPNAYKNARMTPMGLFEFIAQHPEHVIVLDDISTLFKNDQAMQILLAALDGKPGEPRTVTYKSKDGDEKIPFTGAIVAISNIPLRCDPLARALGSRIVMLEHEPTEAEIAAFMRQLAVEDDDELSSDERREVVEFVIEETRQSDLRLDLRHLTKAWQDYRQHKNGEAKTPWQDLVRTSLRKFAIEFALPMTKAEDIELQRQKVRDALRELPDDRHAQIEFTGLKSSTFYVRLKEVQADAKTTAA